MRTVLAAAAAGALVIGSASGAMATGKPHTVPAPQKNDRLVSVSIKGHAPIDLKTASADATVRLRAKLWDPKRDSAATTVAVTLGVYTKKVGGELFNLGTAGAPVPAPPSVATQLVLKPGDAMHKVKDYSAAPLLKGASPALWTADQLASLAAALDPTEKAYICIASVTVDPADTKLSTKVKKRVGPAKGKAVRDCVKVIDTTPVVPQS
jgi:hypothetical protein